MNIFRYFKQLNYHKKINYFEFFKKYEYAKKFSNSLIPQKIFLNDFYELLDVFKMNIKPDIVKDVGGEVLCFKVPKTLVSRSKSLKSLTKRMNILNNKKFGFDFFHFTYVIRLRKKNSSNKLSKLHENILNNLHLDQYKGVQAIVSLNDWKNNIGATAINIEPISDNPFHHAIRLYNAGKDEGDVINFENIGPISVSIGKELSSKDLNSFKKRRILNNEDAGNGIIFDGFHYPHMGGVWVNEDRISLHVQSYGMIFGRFYLINCFFLLFNFFIFRSIINIKDMIKKTFIINKR